MELPKIAKIWSAVLFIILLTIISCLVYIVTKSEAPPQTAPTTEILNQHLKDLETKATGVIGTALDKLVA